MAETFIWSPSVDPTGTSSFRTRTAQFGNGYRQVAADGINNEQQSWPLTFGGSEDEVAPIVAFLRSHRGASAFVWTPPLGEESLWTCNSFGMTPHGEDLYTVTATFEQYFGSE